MMTEAGSEEAACESCPTRHPERSERPKLANAVEGPPCCPCIIALTPRGNAAESTEVLRLRSRPSVAHSAQDDGSWVTTRRLEWQARSASTSARPEPPLAHREQRVDHQRQQRGRDRSR